MMSSGNMVKKNKDSLFNEELNESRRQLVKMLNRKRKSAIPWRPAIYLEW